MDSSGCAPPTFAAVQRAGEVVAATLPATPLVAHPVLDRTVGRAILVKHEHVLPTGSFKVRGGVHLAATLTETERRAGLVTTSTGNHAQSVAFAARTAGVRATIVMPRCAPAVKRDAVEALGARVIVHGDGLGEAAAHARSLAVGGGYVDPTDPRIILGHATAYLELFTAAPGLAALYVPIGSGTGAVGACVVRDELAPDCAVIGVQSSSAPAGWRSWLSGRIETAPATTRASGLATTSGYPATLATLRDGLADFVLVSDDEIDAAARLLATRAGTLAEGAGAAALAGLVAQAEPGGASSDGTRSDGTSCDGTSCDGTVAVVCTGGNASTDEIARLAGRVVAA